MPDGDIDEQLAVTMGTPPLNVNDTILPLRSAICVTPPTAQLFKGLRIGSEGL